MFEAKGRGRGVSSRFANAGSTPSSNLRGDTSPHVPGLGPGRRQESLAAALQITKRERVRAGEKNVEERLLAFGQRIKPRARGPGARGTAVAGADSPAHPLPPQTSKRRAQLVT